jgi:O-acetylhomoserine (thiol)-lyase
VADVALIAELCNQKNVPFVLDNSLATSYILRSVDYGVAIEIVSAAKYISGGGTSIGGLLIDNGNFDWRASPKLAKDSLKWGKDSLVRTIRSSVARNIGACLSPNCAYLQILGLETLSLRIEKSSSNAVFIAEHLNSHPKICKVFYPGLSTSPFYSLAKNLFREGLCGGLLAFELISDISIAGFLNSLELIKRASNFNDNKSLIIHPRSTLFCEYTQEKLLNMGINDQLIRLSVGIEEIEDIIADIDQALEKC